MEQVINTGNEINPSKLSETSSIKLEFFKTARQVKLIPEFPDRRISCELGVVKLTTKLFN